MKKFITLLVMCLIGGSLLHSQLLIENFDYTATPADSLVMHGWTPHSGRNSMPLMVTSPGLTYSNYAGSGVGNATTVTGGTGSREDAHKTFAPMTQTVYTAFMANVQSVGNDSDYFLHLGADVIGTTFRGKVFIDGNGTGNFAFGVQYKGNTPVTTGYTYTTGTTYLLVIKSEWGANTKLFVNPVIGDPEPVATVISTDFDVNPTNYGSVALRQAGKTYNIIVDGIRIDTTWAGAVAGPPNNPPSTFDLLEPADGYRWEVSVNSEDSLFFRWNRSIDPEGATVTYSFEYDTTASMNSPLYGTYPIGTDSFYIDYASMEAEFINSMGVDSATIYWRILASDGSLGRVSNQLFSIKYILINQPPAAFNLLAPAEGYRWEVSVNSEDSLYFLWNQSIDPEGAPVSYQFEWDTTSTMDSPLHDFIPVGTDTFFLDYSHWAALWLNNELGQDSVTMFWRVRSSDGSLGRISNQQFSMKYVLKPEPVTPFRADLAGYQVVPPTNSQFTGWGYFEMNADSTSLFYRIYIPDGVTPVTIRNNWAGSGTDDPELYSFSMVGDSAVGTQVIPINIARELCAGRLYVMHSGKGIRGQIYKGTSSVTLLPASNLNAIEFEESIELDWSAPLTLLDKSGKTYRFNDKQFSRRLKKADNIRSTQAPPVVGLLIGYNIYRSEDGIEYDKIAQTDSLFYIDNDVTTGTDYLYFVSAVYLEGQAPWTDTIEATPATSAYPISVLFVTDENLGFGNAAYIRNSFTNLGLLYDHFNAIDSGRTPTSTEMEPYDLVIWYCSYDGVGSYFWNGNDNDNTELAEYLDNGGNVWVMGTDLLYDRYNGPPVSFSSTDFPNKYLGIASYDVQSYGNDGSAGCPKLFRNTSQSVCQVDSFGWIYPTAWWIDGLTPAAGALSVYKMGPLTYSLANKPTAIYYDNGIHKALGFYFDPYEIDTDTHRDSVFADALQWFSWGIVGINDKDLVPKETSLYQNYPNPFNPTTSIKYDLKDNAKVTLKIYNTLGQEVRTLVNSEQTAGQYTMQWDGRNNAGLSVSSGVYIYRIQAGDFVKSKKMMFIK